MAIILGSNSSLIHKSHQSRYARNGVQVNSPPRGGDATGGIGPLDPPATIWVLERYKLMAQRALGSGWHGASSGAPGLFLSAMLGF